MKRKAILFLTLIVVLCFGFSSNVFADSSPYAIRFMKKAVVTQRWASPIVTSSGTSLWPSVTSKWNEVRSVNGSSPHVGIDLGDQMGDIVGAVTDGYLTIFANNEFNTVSLSTDYPGVFCHYQHMTNLGNGDLDLFFNQGEQVGTMSNYSTGDPVSKHLHFGAYNVNTYSSRISMENSTLFANSSSWNYGRRVDTYSYVQWDGTKAKIDLAFYGDVLPVEVKIYHRAEGATSWIDGGSMNFVSGYTYEKDLSQYYSTGDWLEWMVRVKRNNTLSYPYIWAPAKFYRPDANPNATTYAYAYYAGLMQ